MPEIRLNYDHAKYAVQQFATAGKGVDIERRGKVESKLPTAQRISDILVQLEILLSEYSGLIQLDAKRIQQYVENIKAADEPPAGGGGFR